MEDARSITRCFVHASESDSVLFTGSNGWTSIAIFSSRPCFYSSLMNDLEHTHSQALCLSFSLSSYSCVDVNWSTLIHILSEEFVKVHTIFSHEAIFWSMFFFWIVRVAFDALSRVVDFLHLRGSPNMVPSLPIQSLPVVFVNSLETLEAWSAKDSSILAEIVLISGTQQTCIDEGKLIERLRQFSDRPLRIGCFSASSSSTGCGCDVGYVTHLLHSYVFVVRPFALCVLYLKYGECWIRNDS